MDEILKQPAYKIVELINAKAVSSEEVTRIFLKRIHEVNPTLNAVIQIDEKETLRCAKKANQTLMRGETLVH